MWKRQDGEGDRVRMFRYVIQEECDHQLWIEFITSFQT